MPNFSGLNPPTITQKLSGISQWVTSLGIQPAPPGESRLARSSASTPSAKENSPRPPSCSRPPAWALAVPNPGAIASATTSFSILTALIPMTTTPITTILIAKTLTAPILITTTLTTTTPATAPLAAASGKMVYTADDIDVLVAHIIPLDIWYVLPIEAFAPCKSLRFYPQGGCKRPHFEHYREAWHLLRSDHQQ